MSVSVVLVEVANAPIPVALTIEGYEFGDLLPRRSPAKASPLVAQRFQPALPVSLRPPPEGPSMYSQAVRGLWLGELGSPPPFIDLREPLALRIACLGHADIEGVGNLISDARPNTESSPFTPLMSKHRKKGQSFSDTAC